MLIEHKGLPGGIGGLVPPDPIPNSEVKLPSADDSVRFPHAKVGHCQALNAKPSIRKYRGFFYFICKTKKYWPWSAYLTYGFGCNVQNKGPYSSDLTIFIVFGINLLNQTIGYFV